jgi:16S rRNA (guanine527-N7)-methyltransferase
MAADETLVAGIIAAGLDAELATPLQSYLDELAKWNRAYNLTAIRDPAEMVTRHVLDSLTVLPLSGAADADGWRLLDVGSGAGLPGLVLAIARPQWQVAVLDGNGKKARFLRHAVRTLGLGNVEVVEARVEAWRSAQPFDRIISRAFGSLEEFVVASDHLLDADGRWLAMKGKVAAKELSRLPPGMSIEAIHPLQVTGLREARSLVVVRRN